MVSRDEASSQSGGVRRVAADFAIANPLELHGTKAVDLGLEVVDLMVVLDRACGTVQHRQAGDAGQNQRENEELLEQAVHRRWIDARGGRLEGADGGVADGDVRNRLESASELVLMSAGELEASEKNGAGDVQHVAI